MSDQIIKSHVTRRAALASLAWLVAGCTSPTRAALALMQTTRITFLEPRYSRDLEMQVPDWPGFASAATIDRERARAAKRFERWHDIALPNFSEAMVSALRRNGMAVDRLSDVMSPERSPSVPFIQSYLSAGFVFKTMTSATYAPFVTGLLQVWDPIEGIAYKKLYVASDRSFNIFMTRLAPATPLLLDADAVFSGDLEPGLNAFRLLAQQLGERFAVDLLSLKSNAQNGATPHNAISTPPEVCSSTTF